MTNKFEKIANEIVEKLNELYEEKIFKIKDHCEEYSSIINDKYRYEGNDVDLMVDEDGIMGTITGSTVNFSSIEDVLENIDQLFINDNK